MTNASARRELPPWVIISVLAVVIIVLAVMVFRAVKPVEASNHTVMIGPNSKSSYLNHYAMPSGSAAAGTANNK